ncbi:4Fe-4S binding protein [Mycolicibacterium aromaticivorans]|uniref:4Fe-4S binding protein n=1 Tax=Mycolicibacterium aromaticivorans TaxID=318425 RepID=UPI000D6D1505
MQRTGSRFPARRRADCAIDPHSHPPQARPGNRYAIDYDYWDGCGICIAECPSGAIEMNPEQT